MMSRVEFSDDEFDGFDDLLDSDELNHDVMADFEIDEDSDLRIHDNGDSDDNGDHDDDTAAAAAAGGGSLAGANNNGEPNFQHAALKHILQHQSWMDDGKTTISDDALEMVGKLTKLFITEALGRASKIAHANAHLTHHQDLPSVEGDGDNNTSLHNYPSSSAFITEADLQKIMCQLLLDFS